MFGKLCLIALALVVMWCAFHTGLMGGIGTIWDKIGSRGAAWPLEGKPPDLFTRAILYGLGTAVAFIVLVIVAMCL